MRTLLLLAWLSLSVVSYTQTLVAYYPFNGNPNDESGNGRNPTYVGASLTTDRFGNANHAYEFSGMTSGHIEYSANGLPATNRTISLWFYTADVANRPGLLGYGGNGSCGTTLFMALNLSGSGQYNVQGHCGANAVSFTYSSVPVNQWYHWVLTINGSVQKIYVNGVLKSTDNTFSGNTATSGSAELSFGVIPYTNGLAPYIDGNVGYLNGKLDDIRIYDAALSDAQVLQLYQNESTGLVAYYPFNGNANDESGSGYNGTVSGATLTSNRYGVSNSAYQFNGIGSAITLNNSTNMDFVENSTGKPFSLSAWARLGTNSGNVELIVGKHFCGSYGGYLLVTQNGTFSFWTAVNGNSWVQLTTAQNFLDDKWHHVVATYDGVNQKIYVDGLLKGTLASAYNSPATGIPVKIGQPEGCGSSHIYNGKLDDIRIYNISLNDAQVLQLYQTESTGLVAYYPFNGNANDESGNGYNGTVAGASLTTDRFNQSDKAYSFVWNGTSSDKIQVPGTSSLNFNAGGFSISAWFKFSGTSNAGYNYPIVSKHNCGENSGYILMLYNDKLTFWIGGAGWTPLSTTESYIDNNWHQVTAVYDGTNRFIYVDGVAKATDAVAYTITNAANIALGGYNGCNGGFNGKVDEVKIYSRPLNATEVQSQYYGLVAYYPFNGNANDESGNGHDGTVSNVVLTTDRKNETDKAYAFNGSTSSISAPAHADWSFNGGDFSIASWINVNIVNTSRIVSAGYVDNDGIWGLGFGQHPVWGTGKRINFFVFSGNNYSDYSSNEIIGYSTGQWAHVGVIKKGTTLTFYFNGAAVGTAVITPPVNANSYLSIGCRQNTAGSLMEFFNGKIDELRIYKRALSPNEMAQLADIPFMPDLLAYLPMNGDANDKSGNNRNGSPYGNSQLTTDKYDNNNSAYSFTNPESGISLANTNTLDFVGQPFAISAWVRYSNIPAADFAIVAKHNCGVPNGYVLSVNNNIPRFYLSNGGWSMISASQAYNDNKWHHLVATYDGIGSQKLYVDGELKASAASVVYNTPGSGAPIIIGDANGICGGATFSGSIDEVKIYGAALDANQVTSLYKQSRGSGNALLFQPNSTNRVEITDEIPAAGIPPDLTFEAWIKRNSSQPNQWLFAGNQIGNIMWGLDNNTMVFGTLGSAFAASEDISVINNNKWHHVAVTYNNTTGLTSFYVDGLAKGAANGSYSFTGGNYAIGCKPGTNESYDGLLDEMRIWGAVRSQNDIRDRMCQKLTNSEENLGLYFKFDEASLNRTYDVSSGFKTTVNGPQYVLSGAPIGDRSAHDFVNPDATPNTSVIYPDPTKTNWFFRARPTTTGTITGLTVYQVLDEPLYQFGILGAGGASHYFGVHVSGATTGATYNAIYVYAGNPLVSGYNEPTLKLYKRNDNSITDWIDAGAALNTTNKVLVATGQSTEYILGSSGFGLPVTLLSFEAKKINATTVQLNWKTATEINNKGFEVQRSFDGSYFVNIGFVNGAGNSDMMKEYITTDIPGKTGRVYYRLKQVDFDDQAKLSQIVSVVFDKQGIVKVYPNPAQQKVTIEGADLYSRIQLFDAGGRMVREKTNNNQYLFTLNLEGLKSGIYLLQLGNSSGSQTLKLVIGN